MSKGKGGDPEGGKEEKFTPIPKRGVPLHTPIIPAPSAIWKMELGHYVPLWYYTNAGLANQTTFDTANEDTLTIITRPDSLTMAMRATNSHESKGLVKDHNLTFKQFQLAVIHMLMAMQQSAWPKDHIEMMETFWMNFINHPSHSSTDEHDVQVLLLYQSKQ